MGQSIVTHAFFLAVSLKLFLLLPCLFLFCETSVLPPSCERNSCYDEEIRKLLENLVKHRFFRWRSSNRRLQNYNLSIALNQKMIFSSMASFSRTTDLISATIIVKNL